MNSSRLLAIGDDSAGAPRVLDTSTGELHPVSLLAALIGMGEPGIICGYQIFPYIAECQAIYADNPDWTCRIATRQQTLIRRGTTVTVGNFIPTHCGFRDRNRNRKSRIFRVLDLSELTGRNFGTVSISEVVDQTSQVLDMLSRRGSKFATGRGGIGLAIMRASKEWSKERRPAPSFINDMAREKLPGNHYALHHRAQDSVKKTATYLDQSAAHHQIAATLPLPDPASMRARGLERSRDGVWCKPDELTGHIGLVLAMCSFSPIPPSSRHLFPPFMLEQGRRLEYVYTNELDYFDGVHATMEYAVCAWTSTKPDSLLPEYAAWCLDELKRPGKNIKKGALLAAYGALATRPRLTHSYVHDTRACNKVHVPIAGDMKPIIRQPSGRQPKHVNVIARGMIEAETRKRSLRYARELERMGIPVWCVYVDGLIIGTDSPPIPREGWRVSHQLTDVRFLFANSFTSRELEKMPGVPLEMRRRRDRAMMPVRRTA